LFYNSISYFVLIYYKVKRQVTPSKTTIATKITEREILIKGTGLEGISILAEGFEG